MSSEKYHVQVVSEDRYTFHDYKKILQLEYSRINRLISSFDHIQDGNKYLVPLTQKPRYSLNGEIINSQDSVDYYQRYGQVIAYYGVPARPAQSKAEVSPMEPYALSTDIPELSEEDRIIQKLLGSGKKIICCSDAFWAEYHFLLHSEASQTNNRKYSWEETPKDAEMDLATPCYKYSPYTFQSWLFYRAPIEKGTPLIILDEYQWNWLIANALDQLPNGSEIVILSHNGQSAVPFSIPSNSRLRSGHYLYNIDLEHAKNASCKDIKVNQETEKWPKISVVVCSYNQGDYLSLCLDSILKQNYPNLELIVVDGNSTDQSIEVLESYRDKIDYLICEDDDGQSDALNKGFNISTGDVMTWVCSDDGLEPNSLFTVAQTFLSNQVDMVVGACRKVSPDGNGLSNHHTFLPFNEKVRLSFGDMISFGYTWLKGYYFIQPELFWSRNIWEKSGAYIKNHMFFAMDYELFLRFALAGGTIIHIQPPLAFALVHEAQKTSHKGQNLPTIIRMIDEFQEMLSLLEGGK